MKKGYTHVCVVLDASGSMDTIEDDVRGSLLAFAKSQGKTAAADEKIAVDAYKFGSDVKKMFHNASLDELETLAEKYEANMGCTALYDAVCIGIDELGSYFAELPESERPEDVVFAIVTDGYENSSVRFENADVQARIKEQSEKYGWQFLFLAAGIDAKAAARDIGIDSDCEQFACCVQSFSRESACEELCECMDAPMERIRNRRNARNND